MNKVFVISYDLKSPDRDYEPLMEAIKRSPRWWHHLKSTWLISTSETASQIWTRLAPHINTTDNLLIIEVKKHYGGWLGQKAWDWIESNVPG